MLKDKFFVNVILLISLSVSKVNSFRHSNVNTEDLDISINLLDLRGETDLSILDFKNNIELPKKLALTNNEINKFKDQVLHLTKSVDESSNQVGIKDKSKNIYKYGKNILNNQKNDNLVVDKKLPLNVKKDIKQLNNDQLDSNLIDNEDIGRKSESDLLNIALKMMGKSQLQQQNDFPVVHFFTTNLNRDSKSIIVNNHTKSVVINKLNSLFKNIYQLVFKKEANSFITIVLLIIFQLFGHVISYLYNKKFNEKIVNKNPLKIVRKKKVININFLSPKQNNNNNQERSHHKPRKNDEEIEEMDIKLWYIYPCSCGDYVPYIENPILVAFKEKERKRKSNNNNRRSKAMTANISYFNTGNSNYLESFYNVNISDIYPDYSSTGYLDEDEDDNDNNNNNLSLSDIYDGDENDFYGDSHEEFKEAGSPFYSDKNSNNIDDNNNDDNKNDINSGNKQISKKLDKFFIAPPRKMSLKNKNQSSNEKNSNNNNNNSPFSEKRKTPYATTPTDAATSVADTNTGRSNGSNRSILSGISMTGFVRGVKGLKRSLFTGNNKNKNNIL